MVTNDRRKRVQRLKILILATILLLILIPSFLCIYFGVKVSRLEKQIEQIQQQLNQEESLAVEEEEKSVSVVIVDETQEEEDQQEEETEITRKVYLTFDDGPSRYTDDILDILKEYDVKATFFVTAMNASQYPDSYQRIVDEGHTLGIHSYSHVYQDVYASLESFKADFTRMQDYLYEATGQKVMICRLPGGSSNTVSTVSMESVVEWLDEEGIVYYDWNISSGDGDYGVLSPEEIANNCIEGVKIHTNAVVLLHDAAGKKNTMEALPLIIEGIRELDDTVLLPIDEDAVPIQHISITRE